MPTWIRLFSLEEANALIPELERMLQSAKKAHDRVHAAEAHVNDLEIVWGDQVEDPSCPDHGEYLARKADLRARRLALFTEMDRFRGLGVELKDIDSGLLDFYAMNGEHLVYLCWRKGEPSIQAWHGLRAGFAGRRPIPEFLEKGPSR